MAEYVALLRGINIGPHKRIKMDELRKAFEAMGLSNVRTLLATGNVIFEASETDADALVGVIEAGLTKAFDHNVPVILRRLDHIRELVQSGPFDGVEVTKDTRLYVTFLSEKPLHSLDVPYESPGQDFTILQVSDGEVCSVLTLTEKFRTVDSMKILEKQFGKGITTRNWNTVNKLLL